MWNLSVIYIYFPKNSSLYQVSGGVHYIISFQIIKPLFCSGIYNLEMYITTVFSCVNMTIDNTIIAGRQLITFSYPLKKAYVFITQFLRVCMDSIWFNTWWYKWKHVIKCFVNWNKCVVTKSSGTISLINFKINIMLTTTTTTSFVGEDAVILQMSKEFFTFLTSLLTDEKDIDNRF